ncbi:methyltransferase domain-containing protein, partial [Candidatus Fermentibacteria bacterium]|nr:methyltransferase domain-containing protein [Candidatus Fermentibacteria bacterium]
LFLVGALAVVGILVRRARRHPTPCPWWLRFLLENPFMNRVAGASTVIARLDLAPGMQVLDVGCGPGRLTLPLARQVAADGKVVAVDMQERMLAVLRERLAHQGITNVETILKGAGQGDLGHEDTFDRAVLVTVLGEIRGREEALREIFCALKPGGILSVTEVLLDPDYQPASRVRRMAETAGFEFHEKHGSAFAFTITLRKPKKAHPT